MRIAVASIWGATFTRGRRLPIPVLAAALGGSALIGCAGQYAQQDGGALAAKAVIPLPERALLAPQAEPACTLKVSGAKGGDGQTRQSGMLTRKIANLAAFERSDVPIGQADMQPEEVQLDPNASLAQRIKLEYERNCFQQAEARVRARLRRLQLAVGRTIVAVKRNAEAR